MPNTILFNVDSITADRQTAVVKYDDPADTQGGLFVGAFKVNDEAEETAISITPDDDPWNVTQWEVELSVDGWYRISGVIVPDFDPLEVYNQYDCVYSDGENGFGVYRYKMNSPSTPGNEYGPVEFSNLWDFIEDPVRLAYNVGEENESANVNCGIYDVILSPNTEYEYAKYLASLGKEVCSVDCSLENLEMIIRLATIIDGMTVRNDRSEMPAGERLARRAVNIITQMNG